jgi:anti-sigma factor RsiW
MMSKNHEVMKNKMFALYDGELAEAERKEAEAHLASCPECRSSYEQWQKTAKAFFKPVPAESSDFFVSQVMNRIKALEKPRQIKPWVIKVRWLVPATVAALGLLLFMTGPFEQTVSVENLLLGGEEANSPAQFFLASKPAAPDEVFGLIMEGKI